MYFMKNQDNCFHQKSTNMKLNLILVLLVGVAPLLMSNTALSKHLLAGGPVTTSTMVSFDQTFFVSNTDGGEDVHFTGLLHLVTIAFPTDPVFPNDPVRIQTNVVNLTGVGTESGLTYTVRGTTSQTFAQPYQPGDPYFVAVNYRLLPPSPIQPLSNSLRFNYTINFDNLGKVVDALAEISVVEGPF
jgi:hypothetical protein